MARIFLSYRRDDSAYVAATLSEKLQNRFGSDSVFFDVDAIPLGVDFREYIANAVGQCDVLLVLIGDNWIKPTAERKAGRLDDPTDYVRIEIESALKRDIPVIPILVGEALMPPKASLPESIQSIVFRNATEIRAGRDLRQHIDRFIEDLETLFKSGLRAEEPATIKETAGTPPPNSVVEPPPRAPAGQSWALDIVVQSMNGLTDAPGFFCQNIPEIKLKNAIDSYAQNVAPKEVLLLYDDTLFGGAKDGLLLTDDAVHWRNLGDSAERVRYCEVKNVKFIYGILVAEIEINDTKKIHITGPRKNEIAKAIARMIQRLIDH